MNRKLSIKIIGVLIMIFVLGVLILSGCKSNDGAKSKEHKIRVAEQYGLAYAPLQIMKENKIMEKNLPGVEVSWEQVGNTAAIREAMLANKIDAGFMAIPPFLIGWDKGMEWRIASGLSSSPIGLVTYRDDIKTIRGFTKDDRIALPQPGSVQHILLSMACEREFSDAKRLDDLLVTMKHPDGMNALLTKKDITAHFTSPPYIFKELEQKGMHQILSGSESMGKDFTFIIGVTTNKFHDNNPLVYNAFVKSLHEAMEFIQNDPEKSAKILSNEYNLPKEEVLKYITSEGMEYDSEIRGIYEFADFMVRNDYISKTFEDINNIIWEDVQYEK
ncbi:ABC transporter substrate-binding protein [Wukongibacter sp. M2B1]|uniref:ABC transporter substrate-binding protein n=1 Tax=Wukongibacter sp. M2B1 TaxID=3088895 RepID=UPI003D79F6F0